ncbi:hypothetical protein CRG98_036410 [Punica granatum]|uniref:Uncharacterized protein n=1 Tax=Punica granatum TaxID=22663 RepID=A0A2I0IGP7_PUNGR|nr:hypothetical protein CRG98_036410 [Punica granatum]
MSTDPPRVHPPNSALPPSSSLQLPCNLSPSSATPSSSTQVSTVLPPLHPSKIVEPHLSFPILISAALFWIMVRFGEVLNSMTCCLRSIKKKGKDRHRNRSWTASRDGARETTKMGSEKEAKFGQVVLKMLGVVRKWLEMEKREHWSLVALGRSVLVEMERE